MISHAAALLVADGILQYDGNSLRIRERGSGESLEKLRTKRWACAKPESARTHPCTRVVPSASPMGEGRSLCLKKWSCRASMCSE